eukprot:232388_1
MVEVSNSIREIMVLIEVILCYFLTPFVIYWYIKFNKLSHSIMFQKRHPNILKFTGIITIYWFSCAMPLVSIAFAELDRFKGNIQIVLDRLNVFFYPIGTAGIFITIAWRFWHIYFDLKYSSSQKNSEWKYHLDPSLVEHNFWLRHKKDYGSSQWTKKIVIPYFILTVLILCINYEIVIGTSLASNVGHGVSVIIHSITMGIVFILWLKIPKYSDHFFIREEASKSFLAMIFVVGLTFISVGYGISTGSNILLMMICADSGSISFIATEFVSFVYIPKKIRIEQVEHNLAKLQSHCTNSNESSVRTQEGSRGAKNIRSRGNSDNPNHLQLGPIVRRLSSNGKAHQLSGSKQSYKLHVILSNERGLKLFMQHLGKEFSMECLLCFVETIQYKFALKKRCDLIDVELIDDDMDVSQPPMAEAAPMSFIVKTGFDCVSKYKQNDDPATLVKEAKNVCLQLFQKYIDIGSELAVNISYESRTKLTHLMSDMSFFMDVNSTPNDLFKIFDEVSTEMFRLMHGAYVRFKMKPSFDEVVEALQDASS